MINNTELNASKEQYLTVLSADIDNTIATGEIDNAFDILLQHFSNLSTENRLTAETVPIQRSMQINAISQNMARLNEIINSMSRSRYLNSDKIIKISEVQPFAFGDSISDNSYKQPAPTGPSYYGPVPNHYGHGHCVSTDTDIDTPSPLDIDDIAGTHVHTGVTSGKATTSKVSAAKPTKREESDYVGTLPYRNVTNEARILSEYPVQVELTTPPPLLPIGYRGKEIPIAEYGSVEVLKVLKDHTKMTILRHAENGNRHSKMRVIDGSDVYHYTLANGVSLVGSVYGGAFYPWYILASGKHVALSRVSLDFAGTTLYRETV